MPTKKSLEHQKNTRLLENNIDPLVDAMTISFDDFLKDDCLKLSFDALGITGDTLLPPERERLTELILTTLKDAKQSIHDKLRIGIKKYPDMLSAIAIEFPRDEDTAITRRNHIITIKNTPTFKFIQPRLSKNPDYFVNLDTLAFILSNPSQTEFIAPFKDIFTDSLLSRSVRLPGCEESAFADCLNLGLSQSQYGEFLKIKMDLIKALSVFPGSPVLRDGRYIDGYELKYFAHSTLVNIPST